MESSRVPLFLPFATYLSSFPSLPLRLPTRKSGKPLLSWEKYIFLMKPSYLDFLSLTRLGDSTTAGVPIVTGYRSKEHWASLAFCVLPESPSDNRDRSLPSLGCAVGLSLPN